MFDTVIFDLDGTLLYTLEDLYKSVNYALTSLGYKERSISEVRAFVGNGVEKLIERCLPGGEANPDFSLCLNTFKEYYDTISVSSTHPYDGIVELLDKLDADNISCAVVSNKYDSAVKQLCDKYFGNKIKIAVGECVNVKKKPAPDSVLKVIEELNARKVVYVGDSEVDIETAFNAKIPCISVSWGYKDIDFLKKHNAKCIVESVDELYYKIKSYSF